MSTQDNIAHYLRIAAQWEVPSPDVPVNFLLELPTLDRPFFQTLLSYIQPTALSIPKHTYAILALAAAKANQSGDTFLQAITHWHLAYAANNWLRPHYVSVAIDQAQKGFIVLEETIWLAACNWQLNAQPWTRPNYFQSHIELESALKQLKSSQLSSFVYECRLSLAYVCLMLGEFETAEKHLQEVNPHFQSADNTIGWGVWLFTHAVLLRRRAQYKDAIAQLTQALQIFRFHQALVYKARTHYTLGYCYWSSEGDYETAEGALQQAISLSQKADTPLLTALCYNGLGEIYNNTGRLTESGQVLQQAQSLYAPYDTPGIKADNQLESGFLELYNGRYQKSQSHFQEAARLYTSLKLPIMVATAAMYQGETARRAGSFQQALHYLEQAQQQLQKRDQPWRAAECDLRLAYTWLALGREDKTQLYLERARNFFAQTNHPTFLATIDYYQAEICLRQGKPAAALQLLQTAEEHLSTHGRLLSLAFVQKLRAEVYLLLNQYSEAFDMLKTAESYFAHIGRMIEQADCQLLWGRYYQQIGQFEASCNAWTTALALNQDTLPGISWQAHAGLASLYQQTGQIQNALTEYRHMIHFLTQLRGALWQPALVGDYLRRPAPALDAAIMLATRKNQIAYALAFIEESKAHLFTRQLQITHSFQWNSPDHLQTLAAEIRWLQDKIRVNLDSKPSFFNRSETHLRQQLKQKTAEYDRLWSEWERTQEFPSDWHNSSFDVGRFQQLITEHLGQNWLALDYYLTSENLCGVVITPTTTFTWLMPISPTIKRILVLLEKLNADHLTTEDLETLAWWLFPPFIRDQLTPIITLVISPHRQLHRLPWSALLLDKTPLVCCCIPVVVPSLHSLGVLWQPPITPPKYNGLLLAVSDFGGRWRPLPQVQQEIESVQPYAEVVLRETAVTWSALQTLSQSPGLSSFSFLHIASHAFHDPVSGRVSGIALFDQDIWLDTLQQCAPLSPLVILSACSGSQSKLYEGDEQVGLAITCLTTGAKSVIGSLWPVLDEVGTYLMPWFYQALTAGHKPAAALTLAQRAAWQANRPLIEWGGFLCIGIP